MGVLADSRGLRALRHPLASRAAVALGVALFLIGQVLTFRHIGPVVPLPPDYTMDFDFWMRGARDLAAGGNPYAHRAVTLGIVEVGYVYPPLAAWVLAPLVSALPGRYPYLVWVIAAIIAYSGTLVMALRAGANPVRWQWVALVLGGMSLPYLIRENLFHGQIDFFLATLVTGGLTLLARRKPVAAGLMMAAAANVKPFLVILLLYLAWRGHWRAFFAMGLGGAAILVGGFALMLGQAPAVLASWLEVMGAMGRPPFIGFLFNLSLYGTVVRLFTPTPFAEMWVESRALYLAASGLLVALPALIWLRFVPPGRPRRLDNPSMIFVESGLILALIFACGPVAEANHLLSLTAGIIAAIRLAWTGDDEARRRRWLPAALLWVIFLIAILSPVKEFTWTHVTHHDVPVGLAILLSGKVGLLLLAVAVVTAWTISRERAITDPHLSIRATARAAWMRVPGRADSGTTISGQPSGWRT